MFLSLLSSFRFRLLLALPLVWCVWLWLVPSFPPREHPPGERYWYSWRREYIGSYLRGPMSMPEYMQKLTWIHEYRLEFPGFRYVSKYIDPAAPAPFASQCYSRSLEIHYAYITALSALPLAAAFLLTHNRRRAAARQRRSLCPHCGYDLRAHAVGQKCPECGTPVSR